MQVTIGDQDFEFDPDYPNDWFISAGDPFKYPVDIGGHQCFVKRFETQTPQDISGWSLLQTLRGAPTVNMPTLFDIREVPEGDRQISYLFYEHIEGNTLEHVLKKGAPVVDAARLLSDLFDALNELHRRGYWFSDFCEKNIFCNSNGRYMLVDLDSAQPLAVRPTNDLWGSKTYWAPVYRFYTEILKRPGMQTSDLSGVSLDLLELTFLILHLQSYQPQKWLEYNHQNSYQGLPAKLDQLQQKFRNMFLQLLNISSKDLPATMEAGLKPFLLKTLTNTTMNGSIQLQASKTIVRTGEAFTLSWDANADRLDLYRKNVFLQSLGPDLKSVTRTDFGDGDLSNVTYHLLATKNGEQSQSNIVVISNDKSTASSGFPRQDIVSQWSKTVAWAKFIGVIGMAVTIFGFIGALTQLAKSNNTGFILIVILSSVILFYPMLLKFRFANQLQNAIHKSDQSLLAAAFRTQRMLNIYSGVLLLLTLLATLIGIAMG